jgi:hypothetical protein
MILQARAFHDSHDMIISLIVVCGFDENQEITKDMISGKSLA